MDFVRTLRPHQATFVPDSETQSTSDHGWTFPDDAERLRPPDRRSQGAGRARQPVHGPDSRNDGGGQGRGRRPRRALHRRLCRIARNARREGCAPALCRHGARAPPQALGINAGHDLSRDNLTAFLRAVPGVQEVSIGHAFVADALELGYTAATRDYLRCINEAR